MATDEEIERLRIAFRECYQGSSPAGRVIIMPAGVDIVIAGDDTDAEGPLFKPGTLRFDRETKAENSDAVTYSFTYIGDWSDPDCDTPAIIKRGEL